MIRNELNTQGQLKQAVRSAFWTGLAGAAFAPTAFAQGTAPAAAPPAGENATELETLEVTGSRIRRVDMETASPVYTIDRATIEASGVTTLGELIQEIPSISGIATNPQVNNGGGTGAAVVSLRGLGEERTLVLLNGRRLGPSFDVNSLPINLIERVEVLKEGAGAIYGSDAVGGVVNFITRKNISDANIALQAGQSSEGDGDQKSFEGVLGFTGQKGNLAFGLNYNRQDAISAADRGFSKNALYIYNYYGTDTVLVLGSSRNPRGRLFTDTDSQTAGVQDPNATGCVTGGGADRGVTRIPGTDGDVLADYRCYSGAVDSYDYQPFNLVVTPQERTSFFTSGNYQVTDSATAFLDYFHNFTQSGFVIAPLPFDARSDQVIISRDSIYNPFGYDFGGAPDNPSDPVNPNFLTRFVNLGNRFSEVETNTDQITTGLRGNIGDSLWNWDLALTYQHVAQNSNVSGYIQQTALQNAVGPSFVDGGGVERCGSDFGDADPSNDVIIQGCTPINLFNTEDPDTVSRLNAISSGYENQLTATTKIAELTFSGDIFTMPGGPAMLAVGLNTREDKLKVDVDGLVQSEAPDFDSCDLSGETCSGDTAGKEELWEVFGEFLLPIVSGAPGAEALNLTLGLRHSDYDSFGTTDNFTGKIEWRPIKDLMARVSYAEVFRAPTIFDRFGATATSNPLFFDPCVGFDGNPTPEQPFLPAACVSVPTDGSFTGAPTQQIDQSITSNPNLEPETGDVLTLGFVFDPGFLPGFSTAIDYWKYQIDDAIIAPDVNTIAATCAETGDAGLCGLIERFSDGQIDVIRTPTANSANFTTSGIDLGFKYIAATGVGRIRAGVDLTKTLDFTYRILSNSKEVDATGTYDAQFGHFAEMRSTAFLGYGIAGFDAQWTTRFIDGVDIAASFGPGSGRPAASGPIHRGSITYHDVAVSYEIPNNGPKLMLGVENVFDRQPPLFWQYALNANTVVETYDAVGAYGFLRISQNF